ncbi:hypothetical protein CULT_1550004 [[Clostridium] ultunense Esp]|nr:hypothetical protein CULT_1550004 [[Clostridium] ultunense Esp]
MILKHLIGDVSLPLSREALGCAVGASFTLDAGRQWCGVRTGLMPKYILITLYEIIKFFHFTSPGET